VSGRCDGFSPSGRKASAIAFATAAGAVSDDDSPQPLAPTGVKGYGVSTCAVAIRGASAAVRQR